MLVNSRGLPPCNCRKHRNPWGGRVVKGVTKDLSKDLVIFRDFIIFGDFVFFDTIQVTF
jgi:hypothetical protein